MRTLFAAIGLTLSALCIMHAVPAYAMESASYTLESDYNNDTTQRGGEATNFTLYGEMSWKQSPLTGDSFTIVPSFVSGASSSAAASSVATAPSTDTGGSGGATPPGGGRRSSASSFAESSLHGAAGAQSSSRASVRIPGRSVSSAASFSSSSVESSSVSAGSGSFVEVEAGTGVTVAPAATSGAIIPCTPVVIQSPPTAGEIAHWRLWAAALAGVLAAVGCGACNRRNPRRRKKCDTRRIVARILLIAAAALLFLAALHPDSISMIVPSVHAEQTAPATRVYNGHLLNAQGTAVTTAHTFRFSQWNTADFTSTDLTATGSLNTDASNYLNWQETHTVTPDTNGYFSIVLGEQMALPESVLTGAQLLSLFLQVDVKASGAADSAYELLDVDAADTAVDRSQIYPVSLARNADLLDQHDTGTSSGSIAVLGSGGLLDIARIPGGTNRDVFILDNDNSADANIALQFGALLEKTLSYDTVENRFDFSASVNIQGDLTVSGLINGVDISSIQSATGALKAASGGGLSLQVSGGSYRINGTTTNFAGTGSFILQANATNYVFFTATGLTLNTSAFPTSISIVPIAQVTTTAGSIASIQDRRALQSDDRQSTALRVLHPGYEGASYQGDGSDNVGQLAVSSDNINLKNFYMWTSTKPTLQDYDVIIRLTLSPDFQRWTGSGIVLSYRSTSASADDNKTDVQVYDTNGVPVTLVGSSTSLASTSWTSTTLTFSGTPTWTKGQEFIIRLKVSARDNYQMQLGDLKLNYIDFLSP